MRGDLHEKLLERERGRKKVGSGGSEGGRGREEGRGEEGGRGG